MQRPQTIQIFLPSGDPSGLRMAEVTTRIVRLFDVPRKLLKDFIELPEASQDAIYFLIGNDDGIAAPRLYIGQTGNAGKRLAEHNESKEFWSRALVAVSLTNSLTQTHSAFLEHHCIRMAKHAGRYLLENGNSGSRPHTPAPLEADCLEIFETIRTLAGTLGHQLFEPVAKPAAEISPKDLYFCAAGGTNARGEYTSEGFVVLRSSIGRRENVPSMAGTSDERFRQRLIDAGVMTIDGDKVVFTKDHLFGSPSMAAVALLGRTANGWDTWKTSDGRTLNQVVRQPGKEQDK